jgi:hypothetical protein
MVIIGITFLLILMSIELCRYKLQIVKQKELIYKSSILLEKFYKQQPCEQSLLFATLKEIKEMENE